MSILSRFFTNNIDTIAIIFSYTACFLALFSAICESVKAHRLHREKERLKKELNKED